MRADQPALRPIKARRACPVNASDWSTPLGTCLGTAGTPRSRAAGQAAALPAVKQRSNCSQDLLIYGHSPSVSAV
jgi:hypothetical protein